MSAEQTSWHRSPSATLVSNFVALYFNERHQATRANKNPVPMFGQMINKPNIRQAYGSVVIDALLTLNVLLSDPQVARGLDHEASELPAAASVIEVDGSTIFSALAKHRNGPEGLIDQDFCINVDTLATEHQSDPLMRLSMLALEGTQHTWPQEHGVINEAALAIKLYAITSPNTESAA